MQRSRFVRKKFGVPPVDDDPYVGHDDQGKGTGMKAAVANSESLIAHQN